MQFFIVILCCLLNGIYWVAISGRVDDLFRIVYNMISETSLFWWHSPVIQIGLLPDQYRCPCCGWFWGRLRLFLGSGWWICYIKIPRSCLCGESGSLCSCFISTIQSWQLNYFISCILLCSWDVLCPLFCSVNEIETMASLIKRKRKEIIASPHVVCCRWRA